MFCEHQQYTQKEKGVDSTWKTEPNQTKLEIQFNQTNWNGYELNRFYGLMNCLAQWTGFHTVNWVWTCFKIIFQNLFSLNNWVCKISIRSGSMSSRTSFPNISCLIWRISFYKVLQPVQKENCPRPSVRTIFINFRTGYATTLYTPPVCLHIKW